MRFFARRFLFYLLTAWAALTLNFLIPRLMPGNPVEIMIAKYKGQLSPAAVKSLTALFGLNHAGLGSQYVTYWRDLLHGNLGTSVTYFPSSVASVIAAALPWTAVLVGVSMVAEAKGLPKRRIIMTYAARNAVLPSIASFALSLGFVVSGALLVEVVFSYPGSAMCSSRP
ncbi:MAG: ABC transporter permease [Actinomycetota bacterium]|jgi:ABC-type dipeptide/oligopeptide/nickel transport system permease component|nr:ABC transporter permease [Actinomycetota bacterium]